MEKEVICPWCGGKIKPDVNIVKREHGDVRERRCAKCGKILAAYLAEEGDFMPKIRKFQN